MTVAQSNDENYELPPLEQQSLEEDMADQASLMYDIPNIDQSRVEAAWLEMVNSARSKVWSELYTLDDGLIKTSIERSQTLASEKRFSTMHKRPGQKCSSSRCYDYDTMVKWFADRNITTPIFTESIGYWSYKCWWDDCTDALIKATKKTFSFFMSEAKSNGPHYRSVVSSKYSKVWFWIALTKHPKRGQQYILVMHVSN